MNAARSVNAIGLWATLLLGYALLRTYGAPISVSIGAGFAFVIFISDGQITFQTAACEPLFYPLFLGWIYVLPETDTCSGLFLSSLLITAASLTRYIGASFIFLGAGYIAYRRGLKAAILWSAIPCAVMGLWFARNWILVGKLTGHSEAGLYTGATIWQMVGVLNYWMMLVIACSGGLFCLSRLGSRLLRSI